MGHYREVAAFQTGQREDTATVVSSSREKQRTMPAFLNNASTAESLLAIAPVCDDAARLPLSLLPALIAAMRQPLRMSEPACRSNLSGS